MPTVFVCMQNSDADIVQMPVDLPSAAFMLPDQEVVAIIASQLAPALLEFLYCRKDCMLR
jgi:hypothetical protein